ncbi:hypothetical protein KUH03_17960 [Sphingobacterium sp. E70]|uniref:hypothetical protein n=1 Tax=Sphingobacterium sp. E70 TaxID=2853439 RepID=UPI00211C635B|nr:hypothetical protein [Sphingobacterium sp. E70]ULT28303.1 hypothetical protein KUH03_17960 [Sphingobacterium sp. E70]
MTRYWTLLLTALTTTLGMSGKVMAQNTPKDYTGAIKKYDASFSGVGPEVYFLPPPKTENEIIEDNYSNKKALARKSPGNCYSNVYYCS